MRFIFVLRYFFFYVTVSLFSLFAFLHSPFTLYPSILLRHPFLFLLVPF